MVQVVARDVRDDADLWAPLACDATGQRLRGHLDGDRPHAALDGTLDRPQELVDEVGGDERRGQGRAAPAAQGAADRVDDPDPGHPDDLLGQVAVLGFRGELSDLPGQPVHAFPFLPH